MNRLLNIDFDSIKYTGFKPIRLSSELRLIELVWLEDKNYTYRLDVDANSQTNPNDMSHYDYNGDLISYNYIIFKKWRVY